MNTHNEIVEWDPEEFRTRFSILVNESEKNTRELGEAIGASYSLISQWKSGGRKPSIYNVVSIANYFNVSVDWLLGLEDEDNRSKTLDARAAVEYTGLTEEAVNLLHNLYEQSKRESRTNAQTLNYLLATAESQIDYLNRLIESETLSKITRCLVSFEANVCAEEKDELYIKRLVQNRYTPALYQAFRLRYFQHIPKDMSEKMYKEHFPTDAAFTNWVDSLSDEDLTTGLRGRFIGSTDVDFSAHSELDQYTVQKIIQKFMDDVKEEKIGKVRQMQEFIDQLEAEKKAGESNGTDNEENK